MDLPLPDIPTNSQEKTGEQMTVLPLLPRGEWIDLVKDGGIVNPKSDFFGYRGYKLILDYSSFDDALGKVSRESFLAQYPQVRGNIEKFLEGQHAVIDSYLFFACLKTSNVLLRVLNYKDNLDESGRPDLGKLDQMAKERDEVYASNPDGVKLSELIHLALCSEWAPLAKYYLQKAGIESALVMGDAKEESGSYEPHSYLVINPGKEDCYVFDITRPVRLNMDGPPGKRTYFPQLLKPVIPISYNELMDQSDPPLGKLIKCKEILFGGTKYFGVAIDELTCPDDAGPLIIEKP